ncbi:MAG: hypothetical protein HYV29_12480 [Ignavibacteriales bacterium]|nr:hypothetical protein [Ignavibacteriales bacterium]
MPLLLFIIIFLLFPGCKDEPVKPEIIKDPRTYTWTLDTLAYPGSFQTSMTDIWGCSPNDVYVVGHNDQNRGLMWHFDGSSWTDVELSTTQGGPIAGPIDLSAIYGFNKNDIWVVGERIYTNPSPPPNFLDSSLVLHYDGVSWKEHRLPKGRYVLGVWGTSSSNLWTCGLDGQIFHYDGSLWKKESVAVNFLRGLQFISVGGTGSEMYSFAALTQNNPYRETYYWFERKNGIWNILDSVYTEGGPITAKWGINRIWTSPENTICSYGIGGIFKLVNKKWINVFQHESPLRGMDGTSDRNIFVAGDFGKLYHYNGTDWYQLKQFENDNVVLASVWMTERETFIVGRTFPTGGGTTTIILRGK